MMTPTTYEILDPHSIETGASRLLLGYWDRARGARFAPAWNQDFFLEDLGWTNIPNVSVVDVIDGGADYRYRFWGTNHTTHKGFEMSGRLLSAQTLDQARVNGFAQFGEVLRQKRPIAIKYVGAYVTYLSPQQITFRFPLSTDGATVDKIVSYQNLSDVPKEWAEFYTHVALGRPQTGA